MSAVQQCDNDLEIAICLNHVCKRYKHFELQDVNLKLQRGMIMGLIGPNGAGKSTTMRMMMGLVLPDAGEISVFGHPISFSDATAKRDIGYFSEDMRLYKPESIGWHMQFIRSLYPAWDETYARELLKRFGLIERQIVKGLSHGQRVKAMLLLILARRPQILILDEPTNGLDPVAKHEILSELMRIIEDDQRTILYSSHQTQDIELICDWITFIDRGRVIASHNRDDFLETWKRIKINVTEGWQLPVIAGLKTETTFRTLRVLSSNQFDESVIDSLTQSGAAIEAVEPMTLEEIFVSSVVRGREGASS